MSVCLVPELFDRIQKIFRPIEVRPGVPAPQYPGALLFTKEMTGHPRFCGTQMGVDVLWDLDVLEKASSKPHDMDFTAEYIVSGKNVRVLGRGHRYLDYPVNVFLNVCMLHDDHIEVADFCLNLLAEIATVNWCIERLPREMLGCAMGGKDSYTFDREKKIITLYVPTAVYKTLPPHLVSSGAVGRVTLQLVAGEVFSAERR